MCRAGWPKYHPVRAGPGPLQAGGILDHNAHRLAFWFPSAVFPAKIDSAPCIQHANSIWPSGPSTLCDPSADRTPPFNRHRGGVHGTTHWGAPHGRPGFPHLWADGPFHIGPNSSLEIR